MRKNELLVPASSLEVLKIAVIYGADAVYIGGEAFGLRAKAKNFTMEEMAEGIAFAHARGVKVYVTANILAHNYDLDGAREYLTELQNMKPDRPDALIIADPAIFTIAGEVCPDIDRHISTQANNTNYGTFQFWEKLGATRVVTARELSLREIRQIREHISDDLEIETFVHGAMCISYSGRCLLSNYFTGRDANRGACTHPCRWKYSVVEEKRPGEYFPVYENERGTYIFNSKDLCMIEHIPDLLEAGIDSFKIEGRMKTALYVARIIHHDIVYAGARSWQWWRAIGGDYKDGLIREYTDPDLQDGRVEDSKLMWILGNYSRFIRPGAVRMSVETTDKEGKAIRDGDTDQQGLMCSAYRNIDGQWAMVVINYADREQEFTVDVNDPKVKSWQGYRTSDVAGEDLLPVGKLKNKKVAVIPARSVTTFVSGN